MSRNAKFMVAAVVVLAVLIGLFYSTPYFIAYKMKSAAQANDPVTLSSYINFSSLKESLKANFNAMILNEATKKKNMDPLDAMGAAIAAAFINPMIDALVTPENLTMMMKGSKPDLANRGVVDSQKGGSPDKDLDVSMGYVSFDRFGISVKNKNDSEPVTFVLHREGPFSWKLSSLMMPMPKTSAPTASVLQQPSPQTPQPADLSKYVGKHPKDIFKENEVTEKFRALLGKDYKQFIDNLEVSSDLELKGDFYVGSGCAPHSCSIDESAFAVNKVNGVVYAIILVEGKEMHFFGANSAQNLPVPLYAWYKEHGGKN